MSANLNNKTRAVLYTRVSSEEQREGQTIDSQINELEHFTQQRDWHLIRIYKDEGWSGSILARPDLDRLRDDASKGGFEFVVVNDVDRLARDVTHLGIIKRDLERHGVQIIFKKLPDENSPTRNLMVNILGSFAEFEREMIADRTRRGRRYKVEVRKLYLGSYPPYGFRYIPKDRSAGKEGYLEIVTEEAGVVRNMFWWVDRERMSARKVAERLSALKIRPRKSVQGWARSSVLRILHSEMYAGVWHYNKQKSCEPFKPRITGRYRTPKSSRRLRPRNEWLPVTLPDHLRIVSRDQWERVQKRLVETLSFSPRNSKHAYLLKGLVRCGSCSRPYVGDPSHGIFYYRCWIRCGKRPSIKEATLNDLVWSAVVEAILDPRTIEEQVNKLNQKKQLQAEQSKNDAYEIAASLNQLKIEEERLVEAYRTGILSPMLLGEELQKLNGRRTLLQERGNHSQEIKPLKGNDIKTSIRDYCQIAANRIKNFTFDERQQFLRTIIKTIIFEGNLVRIRSAIPIYPDHCAKSGQSHVRPDPSTERLLGNDLSEIAPTTINYEGRNPTTDFKDCSGDGSEEKPEFFEFTIEKQIVSGKASKFWLNQKRGPDGRYLGPNTLAA
jgi:site-specific DNA recombinase